MDNELMLIFNSFAAESISISENEKWRAISVFRTVYKQSYLPMDVKNENGEMIPDKQS